MAKPLTYSTGIAAEICARMTKGETLRTICEGDAMPTSATVLGWAAENVEGFAVDYARAREALIECWAQQIIDIADSADGRDSEHIQRSKLRVDARKWLIAEFAPKTTARKDAPYTVEIVRFADGD